MSFGGRKDNVPASTVFAFSAIAACSAVSVTHPLEVIKVRLQLQGELSKSSNRVGTLSQVTHIWKNEGFAGMYKGLSASIMRQLFYTTTRFQIYDRSKHFFTSMVSKESPSSVPISSAQLASSSPALTPIPRYTTAIAYASGLTAGAIGMGLAVPFDVCNTRMQADGSLPLEKRRNYKNVFDAVVRIVRDEGFAGVYRGSTAAIFRACLNTTTQFGSYDTFKLWLREAGIKDGAPLHMSASLLAGFLTACLSAPVDTIKTRLMQSTGNQRMYSGMFDAFRKIIQSEGVFALYKGFVPQFVRIGPQTVIIISLFEQLVSYKYGKIDK